MRLEPSISVGREGEPLKLQQEQEHSLSAVASDCASEELLGSSSEALHNPESEGVSSPSVSARTR